MTRQSVVIAVSICIHAAVLLVLMTADLWRPITAWPTPRTAMAFVDEERRPVHFEDIELPKRIVHTTTTSASASSTATMAKPLETAPTEAPSGITRETGHEDSVARNARLAEVELRGGDVGAISTGVGPAPPPSAPRPP